MRNYIVITNCTSQKWEVESRPSPAKKFPNEILQGDSISLDISESSEASYRLAGTGFSIQFEIETKGYEFYLQVKLNGFKLYNNVDTIEWYQYKKEDIFEFGLFQKGNTYYDWTYLNAENFMSDFLDKTKILKDVCIVGSHDAGMSVLNGHTIEITEKNVLTQSKSIYDQLMLGVRYFDIRPVIGNGGHYLTGHYSDKHLGRRLGGNGIYIADIVNDINKFIRQHPNELILVNLSHSINTDSGYSAFTQNEWEGLFTILAKINRTCKKKDFNIKDEVKFANLPIGQILQHGNVILFVGNDEESKPALPDFIFINENFHVFDEYSNTNSPSDMTIDQFEKMKSSDRKARPFVLSWTLTPQSLPEAKDWNYRGVANEINPWINCNLLKEIKKENSEYPNIIYTDNIISPYQAFVAMCVNKKLGVIKNEPNSDN